MIRFTGRSEYYADTMIQNLEGRDYVWKKNTVGEYMRAELPEVVKRVKNK